MNAVIVDGDVSYPMTSGKRLRTMNLLLRLARNHRVTYIARHHGSPEEARTAREFLQDQGVRPILVNHPLPRKTGLGFYVRLAGNLLSPLPYSVATHISKPQRDAVAAHAAAHSVNVWQFEATANLDTLPDPKACKVLNAQNVDTLLWQRYCDTETQPLKRWYIQQQWRKFERFERRAFHQVTHVVTCSDDDASLVRDVFGQPNVDVVDNGIDRAFFEGVRAERDADEILFLGALDWRPNLDAIDVMLSKIFPEVRHAHPTARLVIVGRNPPNGMRERVAAVVGAELHANVADVRPFLGRGGVMAVPLRIGGGSRLKILEALATGMPVVSTRVGAEGLKLEPERDLIAVETVEQMASALLRCLREPLLARSMAVHGRRTVLDQYDWDVLALKLQEVWERSVRAGCSNKLVASN